MKHDQKTAQVCAARGKKQIKHLAAKGCIFFMALLLAGMISGCAGTENQAPEESAKASLQSVPSQETAKVSPQESTEADGQEEEKAPRILITVNETVLKAIPEENTSAQALLELLENGPITIEMQDYGGMEKVGDIGTELPRNDKQMHTQAGDLILYQGRSFVIYYAENTWALTKLGTIENVTEAELKELLGTGNVTVTLSVE